ncbi:MAG: hypothetical protein L0G50_15195, partial [Pseudomonas sp.]|nr:hypothetical protein [Pseudomonas sp.]
SMINNAALVAIGSMACPGGGEHYLTGATRSHRADVSTDQQPMRKTLRLPGETLHNGGQFV